MLDIPRGYKDYASSHIYRKTMMYDKIAGKAKQNQKEVREMVNGNLSPWVHNKTNTKSHMVLPGTD
jgi:hypothetical protein